MAKFSYQKGVNNRKRLVLIITALLVILFVSCAAIVRAAYSNGLKPLSSSNEGIVITVEPGSAPSEIAEELKAKGVIKSDWALEWYVRNHNLRDKLKAGTYLFKPSQSVPEIVDQLAKGRIATDLVTILPAQTLQQVREGFIKAGFTAQQVDTALNPALYESHPALTDKPKGANLEGYLYPESFQKDANTTLEKIITQSLDEMHHYLTPDIREGFNKQGLTVHQGIILASIVEEEVGNKQDRSTVAQVFLKRLNIGMLLQSDATNAYAKVNPAYDSYSHAGLPPGPISNVSKDSLDAVANPAQTDWLYFVSGDDGITHFSKTLEEHESLTEKYCKKLCN